MKTTPRTKLFHIEMMRRVPCTHSAEVAKIIGETTQQGRLFPQALSEHFGALSNVQEIIIEQSRKADVLSVPEAIADDVLLHVIIVDSEQNREGFYINLSDLNQFHASGRCSFHAAATASMLVDLYQQRERAQ